MLDFLNKPYPAPDLDPKRIWIGVWIGLFIALALILLEPFGLSHLKTDYKTLKLFGYGVITFIVVVFFQMALPMMFPKVYAEKTWVTYKELITTIAMLICIAICNVLYFEITTGKEINLLHMIMQTFILGSVPLGFLVLLDYQRLKNKHEGQSKAIQPTEKIGINNFEVKQIILLGENEGERLQLVPGQILYLESNSNYVHIWYEESDQIQKQLFRSSLSNMESQLSGLNGVIRCHRSYIVNLHRVKSAAGNAQGIQLDLPPLSETIPVSRKYVNEIRNWFS